MSTTELLTTSYDPLLSEAPRIEDTTAQRVTAFMNGAPDVLGVYQGALLDGPDGIYVSPAMGQGGEVPQFDNIELLPGEQLGAGDSQHGVVFGDIGAVRVAIKPFAEDQDPEKAAHEHDALMAVRALGLDTFQPLALAKENGSTYLITLHRPDVMTLDNVNWSISPTDVDRYQTEVVPNLQFMANSMALMHAKGAFQNDAQPKNYAKSDKGTPIVIDLEDATIAGSQEEQLHLMTGGGDPRDSKIYGDVGQCWYVLIHPDPTRSESTNVFLEGESYETCMHEFEQNFLTPYLKALQEHTDPALYSQLNVDELRDALITRIARTT